MSKHKNKMCFEPDMVPAYRAARYQLSEHHPESSAARGRLLRQEIDRFESILGQPLTTGVVRHFSPTLRFAAV